MLPSRRNRVPAHTSDSANRAIRQRTEASLRFYADHPDRISDRLGELDREWDIERVLEANAATISLIGLALASGVDRRWLALPAAVAGFLLQHALQGWCPPLPVFRSMGVRTAAEIESERYALKALRGDFERVAEATDKAVAAQQAVAA
jgi:hypothetical protein